MLSLTARLLIAASLVLIAALGITGFALDRAFRASAQIAVRDRLQAQVYILLGAAEFDALERLTLPKALPEARFSTPGSGLYALIGDRDNHIVWRSDSLLGLSLDPLPNAPPPAQPLFTTLADPTQSGVFVLGFTVNWETAANRYQRYTFWVAEAPQAFNAQVYRFRRNLWTWLLTPALILLGAQGFILRWGLKPLRQVARQVREIESGSRHLLEGSYPRELRPLTDNLNNLIKQNRSHLERYRNALGDLAHSLKTPLAVLRGAVEKSTSQTELLATVQTQVERMNQTVDYQLQRAAASGRSALAAPIEVAPIVRKVVDSLAKVYADKHLRFTSEIAPQARFHGDQGDLLEVLGNLADNACKWARTGLTIRARQAHGALILEVEDDGPGIPAPQREFILQRGKRADPAVPGYGIGLAVVRDIVEEVYGGQLEIGASPLGGAALAAHFPLPD
ncbi:MAG: ATP-binding protein [Gammaproteobacteria bacterium]